MCNNYGIHGCLCVDCIGQVHRLVQNRIGVRCEDRRSDDADRKGIEEEADEDRKENTDNAVLSPVYDGFVASGRASMKR